MTALLPFFNSPIDHPINNSRNLFTSLNATSRNINKTPIARSAIRPTNKVHPSPDNLFDSSSLVPKCRTNENHAPSSAQTQHGSHSAYREVPPRTIQLLSKPKSNIHTALGRTFTTQDKLNNKQGSYGSEGSSGLDGPSLQNHRPASRTTSNQSQKLDSLTASNITVTNGASMSPSLTLRKRGTQEDLRHGTSNVSGIPEICMTPETNLFSRIRELRQESSLSGPSGTKKDFFLESPLMHQQRLSDGSSAFVHTIKTASMSNGSFSVIPRSLRFSKSNESQPFFDSCLRLSIDSHRPMSSSSVEDEAIYLRGVKRKHILDELLHTEEGYVSDLKALLYLYSTLLASSPSVSDRVRTSVQRNVTTILHVHEQILERLRKASFRSAARRWADTKTPTRLGIAKHFRSRTAEHIQPVNHLETNRFTRHSTDSTDTWNHIRLSTASAEDVLEVAAIFKDAMNDLFVYEEYCANHDSVANELQKHLSQTWSTYETGMESLARAIVTIEQKAQNNRKALTVGDLLIKPIQRICKYPLLFEDLLRYTPVTDGPNSHAEIQLILHKIREVVHAVNLATNDLDVRTRVQTRWLLRDKLNLSLLSVEADKFRTLGAIELCGVLHITYQTTSGIHGSYALCTLFEEYLLVALPGTNRGIFDTVAVLQLSDVRVESSTDGKGLQCASTFYTWKICFAIQNNLHELLLSACSKTEEEQWMSGLRGKYRSVDDVFGDTFIMLTCTSLDLKSVGKVYTSQRSLSRNPSIQRAATVGNRACVSHVIIRNTHNAQDLQEFRAPSRTLIGRSQSHATSRRIPIIEPKRSERIRMEARVSDVWTRDRLPYPGMVGSKSGQIIRASAGSLARKLSLATIHTPFSRVRTPSLTLSSKKSYDALREKSGTFKVRKDGSCPVSLSQHKPKEIPEVDDMRSVVGRMMAGSNIKHQEPAGQSTKIDNSKNKKFTQSSWGIGPDDPASIFYDEDGTTDVAIDQQGKGHEIKPDPESFATNRRKKRWSNPITMLKGWGSEARNVLYHTKLL